MSHRTQPGQRCRQSKLGRNKWKCERYRLNNQQVKNGKRKQETRERHAARDSLARGMRLGLEW